LSVLSWIGLIVAHALVIAGRSKVDNFTLIQGRGDKVPSKDVRDDSLTASGAKASAEEAKTSE
jgi:hypothetical protein